MINRGWVPKDKLDPKTRRESQPQNIQLIRGMGWVFDEPWRFLPKNQPDKGLWLWATKGDLLAYLKSRNAGRKIHPIIMAQTEICAGNKKTDLPIVPEKKILIRNDHLQYAITWYLLALAIAVMYFIYRRSPR
jgi:surfeit locus 1 family protein